MSVHNILIALAVLFEILAAVGVPSTSINLMGLGLACFFLSLLIG
jgi:hypothetical protein